MRDILPSVSLMKDIEFILKLQGDTPEGLCSTFENPVTVHRDKQGAIKLIVAPKMRPRTKQIAIKYHHFWSFVANGDAEIQNIDTKE